MAVHSGASPRWFLAISLLLVSLAPPQHRAAVDSPSAWHLAANERGRPFVAPIDGVPAGTEPERVAIDSNAPVTISEPIQVGQPLLVRAPEIRITAPVVAPAVSLEATGRLIVDAPITAEGGVISLSGDAVLIGAPISAAGETGGRITVSADRLIQWQPMRAGSSNGAGGVVTIAAERYVATVDGIVDSSGSRGGLVEIAAGQAGRLYSSGAIRATGSDGHGGSVQLSGGSLVLAAASVDVSGQTGGGAITISGGTTAELTAAATVRADAWAAGNGGAIRVAAATSVVPGAAFSARGGTAVGDGGQVAFLTPGDLGTPASVDVSAPAGRAGHVLVDPKNLLVSLAGIFP